VRLVETRSLGPEHPDYPPGLRELPKPPRLRVRGVLPRAVGVAIVGTRKASEQGLAFARELAAELAEQRVAVWSGGALGIDAAAHEGALGVGATVAVLGGGLERPSPASHATLFERIAREGGAVISGYADDAPAREHQFLERNHLLAASVSLLVVVECREKSGARSAAKAARALGRPVGAVPRWPKDAAFGGAREELRLGAIPIFDTSDVLRVLADRGEVPRVPRRPRSAHAVEQLELVAAARAPLGVEAQAVLAAVRAGASHVDAVCEASGLPAYVVAGALVELGVAGLVVDGPHGLAARR
jgi:DNA processing protein